MKPFFLRNYYPKAYVNINFLNFDIEFFRQDEMLDVMIDAVESKLLSPVSAADAFRLMKCRKAGRGQCGFRVLSSCGMRHAAFEL